MQYINLIVKRRRRTATALGAFAPACALPIFVACMDEFQLWNQRLEDLVQYPGSSYTSMTALTALEDYDGSFTSQGL